MDTNTDRLAQAMETAINALFEKCVAAGKLDKCPISPPKNSPICDAKTVGDVPVHLRSYLTAAPLSAKIAMLKTIHETIHFCSFADPQKNYLYVKLS